MTQLLWLDHSLLFFINRTASHPVFDSFFAYWTDIHKTLPFQFAIAAFLVWLLAKKKWNVIFFIVLAVLVGTAADFLNGTFIKPFFERPRPFESEIAFDIILRGPAYGGLAFPSSHAVTSFAIATFLSCRFSKAAPYLFCFAFLTSYSRVYCGVHFPSDVLTGAFIGVMLGLLAQLPVRYFRKQLKGG